MIKDRLGGHALAVPSCCTSIGITQLIDELQEYFGQKYTLPEKIPSSSLSREREKIL